MIVYKTFGKQERQEPVRILFNESDEDICLELNTLNTSFYITDSGLRDVCFNIEQVDDLIEALNLLKTLRSLPEGCEKPLLPTSV